MEKKSNIISHLIMLKICHLITLLSLKTRWGLWFVHYISLATYWKWKSGLYTHNSMWYVWESRIEEWVHSSLFCAVEYFYQDICSWKLFKEINILCWKGPPPIYDFLIAELWGFRRFWLSPANKNHKQIRFFIVCLNNNMPKT